MNNTTDTSATEVAHERRVQQRSGRRYRIVRDAFAGYEVQCWRPWWPFWWQCSGDICPGVNTFSTVEAATAFADRHAQGESRVVKYL